MTARKAKKKVAKKKLSAKELRARTEALWPTYTASTKAQIIESFGARETHAGHVRIWLTPGKEKTFSHEAALMLVIKILRSTSTLSDEDIIACLAGI